MQDRLEAMLPMLQKVSRQLRKDYLYCLYQSVDPMYTEREQVNSIYQFSFPEGICFVFYLWATSKIEGDQITAEQMDDAEQQVHAFGRTLDGDLETLIVGNQIFCLCGVTREFGPKIPEALSALLRRVQEIQCMYTCNWTMGVGQFVCQFSALQDSVVSAKHALKNAIVYGGGKLYDGNVPGTIFEGGLTLLTYAEQLTLEQAVQKLRVEEIRQLIQMLFERKRAQIEKYPVFAYMLALQCLYASMQTLRELMPIDRETYELGEAYQQKVDDQATLPALVRHTTAGVLALCSRYQMYLERGKSNPIWLVINYIQEHYTQHITLEELGRCADRNPQYISAVFARECGMSIMDYIASLRIERAKQLLRTSDLMVAEIGRNVGYQDAKYFSRVFQKHVGNSPSAYRKQMISAENGGTTE